MPIPSRYFATVRRAISIPSPFRMATIRSSDTVRILSILFDRLYVLRNQLVHGGATWNSDVNRDQVRDGASLLGCLLPIFVDLMMDNPQHEWPMPNYPVVD